MLKNIVSYALYCLLSTSHLFFTNISSFEFKINMRLFICKTGLTLALLLFCTVIFSQSTVISGKVKDATTQQPIKSVTVVFKGTRKGAVTDNDGNFRISTDAKYDELQFTFIGFNTVTKSIQLSKTQILDVEMQPRLDTTNKVYVRPHKVKYTNKNNPAVELIRLVIDNKDKNQEKSYEYVEYEEYDKLLFSLSNLSEKMTNNKLMKNFSFMMDKRDTTQLEGGRSIMPIFIEEKIAKNYYRKDPSKKKTYVLAEKKVDFGEYIDAESISSFLNYLYQDINVYDNSIVLLNTQFLSPIANDGPSYYKYMIMDTVTLPSGERLIKLNYTPRNPADLLFRGTMYITLDGNYGVQKIDLSLSKYANVNWVKEMHLTQHFEKSSDGRYHVSKSEMRADFGLTQSKTAGGIYGERSVSFKDYTINEARPDSVYRGLPIENKVADKPQPDSFWLARRHEPLAASEQRVYANIDSLTKTQSYKNIVKGANILMTGYVKINQVDVGPASTALAFNPIEGLRLRLGGRTNSSFSKKWVLDGYAAYGLKDKKFKYYGGIAYSFTNKTMYEFPKKFIKVSYQQDVKIPGTDLAFIVEDNPFISFKRGVNDKYLFNHTFKVDYMHEYENHFWYKLGYEYWKHMPLGALSYNKMQNGIQRRVRSLTTSELTSEIRWAPNERFFQGRVRRKPIATKFPIFTLRTNVGIKGFLGGEYNYQKVVLNIHKRVMLSKFGYADVTLEGGNTFGKVPYPLLSIHRGNQTYALELESYNLMNFMEFVSDHYASINLDYKLNGFLFNKIPLLKRLKWREALSFKALYGGLRDENHPMIHSEQIEFPITRGHRTTYALNEVPYVEASVGIGNIFKILRVDYIRRLTYIDHPDIAKWGLRFRFKFDF